MIKTLSVLAILLAFVFAHGQEKKSDEKDKTDEIITNNLMRAQAGSNSKFSISNSINYNGGTLEYPFNENRPNISAGTGNTSFAAITDTVGMKYKIDTQIALSFGMGIRMITPFHGSQVPTGYNGNKVDAYDPYIRYQYLYKWSGIQSSLTFGATMTTQNNLVRKGYVGYTMLQQNNVYDFGGSDFSVGILASGIFTFYNVDAENFKNEISDYSVVLFPSTEYKFNDTFNLRFNVTLFSFEHIKGESEPTTFVRNVVTGSVGLGIKVTRDFFLSPNIQFVPEDARADRTNVGMSATLNLF